MIRIFLDANIFFCAIASPSGGSALVMKLAKAEKVDVMTSRLVLVEAERNISKKPGKGHLDRFKRLIGDIPLLVIPDPSSEEIESVARWVNWKDAPILAAALKGKPDLFLTLNRKHILVQKVQEIFQQFTILTPKGLFEKIMKTPTRKEI
jgi:predicted nucleic acid-binding protein